MEAFIYSLIVGAILTILWLLNGKLSPNSESDDFTNRNSVLPHMAFDIIKRSLEDLGCQPKVNKEEKSIEVTYQGESFQIECNGVYARIWDPGWSYVNANDPKMSFIREAINEANYNFGTTVVMSHPDKDNNIAFHSKRDIILHPSIPDESNYIQSVLDSFFSMKQAVQKEYDEIERREGLKKQERRPIGFAAINKQAQDNGQNKSINN